MYRNLKNSKFMYLSLVILITIVISLFLNDYQLKKEVRCSKKILKFMEEEKIIDSLEESTYKSTVSRVNKKGNIKLYKISNEKYTLELNDEYELVAFTNNKYNNPKSEININKAINLGETYLNKLCNNKYLFVGEVKNKDRDKLPYYALKFQRIIDEYPYYGIEVVLNIHKETGKLVGYINRAESIKVRETKINISEEEAKNIVEVKLEETNSNASIKDEACIAYYNKNDGKEKIKLVYIIKVELLNRKGRKEKYDCFVTADKGDIINIIKEAKNSSYEEK
jgi:hypothetical protein